MFKIISTKKYREFTRLSFTNSVQEIALKLADKVIANQDEMIKALKEDLEPDEKPKEENNSVVNVYKLNWNKDEKAKGVSFKGTKRDLDRFIDENKDIDNIWGKNKVKYHKFVKWSSLTKSRKHPASQNKLAKKIGISQPTLSHWKKLPCFKEDVAKLINNKKK